METKKLSPENEETVNATIEMIMATLGAGSLFWFMLFVVVEFIDNFALLSQ